jgi:hypothetical protein
MIFAVLATGPSLTQAVVDSVRDRCKVVAVSDAYRIAPWAEALASTDSKWWKAHPEAFEFAGQKFTAAPSFVPLAGVERMPVDTATNSGLLGLMVAVKLGATRVLLCGLDMHSPGQHFFGRHPAPLRSSEQRHLDMHKKQFLHYRPRGVEIINCTPGSALTVYPMGDLEEELAGLATSSAR